MSNRSNRILRIAAPAFVLALGAGTMPGTTMTALGRIIPAAHAQTNPCAPAPRQRATNPCAPAARSKGAAANPCAAASRAANPCAAGGRAGKAAAAMQGPAATPFDVTQDWGQAPFGDAMPDIVVNYGRAAPYVGTGGLIADGAMPELKKLGFNTVVSLLNPDEGSVEEGKQAEAAGLKYVNIQVSTRAPTPEQVKQFADIVADSDGYPILLHCESSNRVGAMWALYRASQGVPAGIAIQEGRAVGLKPSREGAVRDALGLPPL